MHTLTYEFSASYYVESVSVYNKPESTARLESYTLSVGDDLTSLTVCASGGAEAGKDDYHHSCGLNGKYLRLSVDNTGDLPLNLREVTAVLRDDSMPVGATVPFASQIMSATLDPYDTVQYWWLSNCFASKCYDGITSATATQNCGSNTTNICHTGYAEQVRRGEGLWWIARVCLELGVCTAVCGVARH